MDVQTDLPRGRLGKEATVPFARWHTDEELYRTKKLEYTTDKFFIGRIKDKFLGLRDDRHIMTIAGSRGGKGRSCIIPNLLHYTGSVLVIDPKGENANITAKRRAELGQNVHVLDPFERCGEHCSEYFCGYNPMHLLQQSSLTLVEDAALIADALVIPSGNDHHWDDSARNFIEGIILHVATHEDFEGKRDLISVYELLFKGEDAFKQLRMDMEENNAASGVIIDAAIDFFDKPKTERSSVLSTVRRHLKFIRSPKMQAILREQKRTFSLDELQEQDTSIYLCLPATRMGINNRWLRLFVNLTLEAVERTSHRRDEPPVLLVLDEFPVLGYLKQLEDAAGQIAGYGVKLWTIIQDLSQLKAIYSDRWETFLGNSGLIQCFANNEMTTLKAISERLGTTSFETSSKSHVTPSAAQHGATGESVRTEVHPLITPEEIARLFARQKQRQIVIYGGSRAMALERVNYDQEPFFSEHAFLN